MILASGSGSNAENIADYFRDHKEIEVSLIGSNTTSAYVLERAKKLSIDSFTFSANELKNSALKEKWKTKNIDYIILAGFLLKIPDWLIQEFPDKIINIHPALLPSYGGKGMYGDRVHQAVYDHKENQTGITIHLVNENYDEGRIIFQKNVMLSPSDLPADIAKKVHTLEYQYFPPIIEDYILSHTS